MNRQPPWPDDTLGRLVWLIRADAEFWCPTGAECNDVFAQTFPDSPAMRRRHALTNLSGSHESYVGASAGTTNPMGAGR